MSVKTTGAELKRFYFDDAYWPDGTWHEDEEIEVDGSPLSEDLGIENLPDDAVVKIAGGYVVGLLGYENEGPSFENYFKKWRKAQNTVLFVVECNKKDVDVLKTTIRSFGGKVL